MCGRIWHSTPSHAPVGLFPLCCPSNEWVAQLDYSSLIEHRFQRLPTASLSEFQVSGREPQFSMSHASHTHIRPQTRLIGKLSSHSTRQSSRQDKSEGELILSRHTSLRPCIELHFRFEELPALAMHMPLRNCRMRFRAAVVYRICVFFLPERLFHAFHLEDHLKNNNSKTVLHEKREMMHTIRFCMS